MDGTLIAHANDRYVDALVGADNGRIGRRAESHASDRDSRSANHAHARFNKLPSVLVVRVHRVLAFIG